MTDEDMARVAEAHDTTAAKIRALSEAGASTTAISTFLGIRYQHSYNVLLRAGRVGRTEKTKTAAPSFILIRLEPGGRITLPDALRARLGAAPGDTLVCSESDQGILIMSRDAALAELQRHAAERMPEQAALIDALLGTRTSGPGS